MPATARVPSASSTLRDGLSTGPRRHPRVPLDTRHSARPKEGKDRRPRTRQHPKVPLVDATLCPGPSRHQETRDSWTPRWQCGSRLQGTRNEDGNVPTPRSVSPHGDRDPGLTPHGDRAHAAKTNDDQTKRRSNERTRNAEKGCLPCSVGTRGQPRGQDGQGACRGRAKIPR